MEATTTLCMEYAQTGKCVNKECKALHYTDVMFPYMNYSPFFNYAPQSMFRVNSKPARFQKMCYDRSMCKADRCPYYHQEDHLLEAVFQTNTFHWTEMNYRRCPVCSEKSRRHFTETKFDLIDVIARPKTKIHCLRIRCMECLRFRYIDSRSLQEMNEDYFMLDAPPNTSLPPSAPVRRSLSSSAPIQRHIRHRSPPRSRHNDSKRDLKITVTTEQRDDPNKRRKMEDSGSDSESAYSSPSPRASSPEPM